MKRKELEFQFRYNGYVKLPRDLKIYYKQVDSSFFWRKDNLTPAQKALVKTLQQDYVSFIDQAKKRMAEFEELGYPDSSVKPKVDQLLEKLTRLHNRLVAFIESLGGKAGYGVTKEHERVVETLEFMRSLSLSLDG